MMEQIHIFHAYTVKVVFSFDFHWLCFNPMAVLPVGAFSRNLTDVDFRIEVCSERIAVVAAVAVENVDGVDLVKQVLLGICAVGLRDARVKARA